MLAKQENNFLKDRIMEIINVESRTWEMMMTRLEAFAERVETLCHCTGDKTLQKWLDNQEVCEILNISKRTLQTYRDTGVLAHTQIGHKMYYRLEDVELLINKLKTK